MPQGYYNGSSISNSIPGQPYTQHQGDQEDMDMSEGSAEDANEAEEEDYDTTAQHQEIEEDDTAAEEDANGTSHSAEAGKSHPSRASRKLGLGDYVDADLYGLRRSVSSPGFISSFLAYSEDIASFRTGPAWPRLDTHLPSKETPVENGY